MKKISYLALAFLFVSCGNGKHDHGSHQEKKHEDGHKHGHHHKHEGANKHMHKTPVKDLIKHFESPERDAYQQPEKVLSYLGEISGKTIIDIGAGSGYFTSKLARKGANVIAADVDDEFLAHLHNRVENERLNNVTVRKIPYDSPDLKPREVDMALVVNTYHHIEDRAVYFKKVKDGLKGDGSVVIIDFFKSDIPVGPPTNHKLSMDLVVSELKKAGFTTFDVRVDLLPYQYIIKAS